MKWSLLLLTIGLTTSSWSQVWKTLPKGVRILGYRNVTTSKITSNFNQFRSESPLGAQFKVDAASLSAASGGVLNPQDFNASAYDKFLVGEYKVDAEAQFNVNGSGFGYGISDNIMFYAEVAYYSAQVKTNIKRTSTNTYEQTARELELAGGDVNGTLAETVRNFIDVDEGTIQSFITNHYGYKPIGNWYGTGYGDMETGVMAKMIDRGYWGLMLYPGIILPTGREDDPDMLQDVGFGDGQFDFFNEVATGYVVNDDLSFGTTFRYTYQAASTKTLRVPESRENPLSAKKGDFNVKYGDRINWMVNSTMVFNDWIAFTPIYRFMYQFNTEYDSSYTDANRILGYNSNKEEHQAQLTTTFSSIKPFLNKEFVLPAQININLVQTIAGKNVPKAGRFEIEFRMLF